MKLRVQALLAMTLLVCSSFAFATTLSVTGTLDPNKPNDVALIPFVLSGVGNLTAQTFG